MRAALGHDAKPAGTGHKPGLDRFWAASAADLFSVLSTRPDGLSSIDAAARLEVAGPNAFHADEGTSALRLLARQFRSPLVLVLVLAAALSAMVGDSVEAAIIALIVAASGLLSFYQEHTASSAMKALLATVAREATVLRDGKPTRIPATSIVPGDVVTLSAGSLVPADGILLATADFNVSEAVLTGETFPVLKEPGTSEPDASIGGRRNSVFSGTSVSSGTATFLAVRTGKDTEVSGVAASIGRNPPETDFARGIRHFGYLMTEIMLAIVIIVFVANLLLSRPLVDSLLFSLALAVGLTPELLPAIISVTLSRGARAMAAGGVIVRRLESIENLGSMDLLCTDKTGTLTEGVIRLDGCTDPNGEPSAEVRLWALLNATLQSGMENSLDRSISASAEPGDQLSAYEKVQELPYDFVRKRLSVVVRQRGSDEHLLICKGAVRQILEACADVARGTASEPCSSRLQDLDARVEAWGKEGYRALGLAVKRLQPKVSYSRDDEAGLTFAGFLLFMDPPKSGIAETLVQLRRRGVAIKMISGDNRYVAQHVAEAIGLGSPGVLTGEEIAKLTKEALLARVEECGIFAEIDPAQKERVIAALRARGHVVGYMGDGINDEPALHEADIGISVHGAADVAREAADMILLERDLAVLLRGGR